jgi:hypothetical protein
VLTGAVGDKQYVIVLIRRGRVSGGQVRLATGPLAGTFRVKPEKLQGRATTEHDTSGLSEDHFYRETAGQSGGSGI